MTSQSDPPQKVAGHDLTGHEPDGYGSEAQRHTRAIAVPLKGSTLRANDNPFYLKTLVIG